MASESRVVTYNNIDEIAEWCGGVVVHQYDAIMPGKPIPGINVPVGDSVERAQAGDILIRNHDGSFQIFKGKNV